MKLNNRVLVVDDDPDILEFIGYNLSNEEFKVKTTTDPTIVVKLISEFKPAIVILDIMIPGIDGIELCHIIRANKNINQPIIVFLTARSEDYTQIAGFEAGADDYITKPIRPRLLNKKVEALLRRNYERSNSKPKLEKFDIDRAKFSVTFEGATIFLPKKEFELLEFLALSPEYVFNRDEIIDKVWGNEIIVGHRTVDVHIRKLREKIGNEYIRTIKGVGYTFEEGT